MDGTHEGLWQSVRALPRPVWLLYAGSFVNRFGSFISVFLILYLVERGYSAAQAGLTASAYGAGSMLAALAGGWLADRLGRPRAIALSMFSAAGTAVALSQAGHPAAVTALTGAFGFCSELYRPASAALLADLAPPERRLPAFAGYRLAINAGYVAGPAVGGLVAERSFFWLFLGEAATSSVLGLVALAFLPEGVRSSAAAEQPGEALRAIRADRRFQRFLLASVLSAVVYLQTDAAFPLHVRASGLSSAVYGALVSLNGLLIVALELPLVGVTRRYRAPRVIAVGTLLTGLGFGLLALAREVPLLTLATVVWTFGEMVAAPVSSAYVADLAPTHLRGRYQGAYTLTWSLARVLAPAVGTGLFAWSPAGLWLTCAALGAAGAALLLAEPAPPPPGSPQAAEAVGGTRPGHWPG